MNKKIFFVAIFPLGLMFLLQSCSSTDSQSKPSINPPPKVAVLPPSDIKNCKNLNEVGDVFLKNIVSGLSTKNYEMYTRDFTPEAKKSFTKDVFNDGCEAVDENLGHFVSDSYMGYYRKGDFNILLWKAKYSKTKDDVLFELYLKKVGETYQVAAFVPN